MTTSLRQGAARGGVLARSRDYYLDALREYAALYGDDFTAACFSPGAAKRAGRPDLVERYYAPRPSNGAAWPSLNAIKATFDGSFNVARGALGLGPNKTSPAKGRRKPGEAVPILNVRERRVVVPDAGTAWLRTQLNKADRRAARLAEQLDDAKIRVVEIPVEDRRKIKDLRDRLSDEKARHRDVRRELAKAERRDERGAREIERLTERLADLRAQEPKVITKTVTQAVPGKPRERTKTVTRTVQVPDPVVVRRAERLEARVVELRASLEHTEATRAELAERLAEIRRDAVAVAVESQRVRAAERRVAEVEKRMALQAELLVGERRQLTDEEVKRLRSSGLAGHTVFTAMVKRVARAHGDEERKAALTNAIGAALNWRDRL